MCDNNWGNKEASVVCRYLGYYGTGWGLQDANMGEVDTSYRVWLDNVKCDGTETHLASINAAIMTLEFMIVNLTTMPQLYVRMVNVYFFFILS